MCGAEASALTPLLVIRPGVGLNWPVHRHQHLQARVQRSLASAGGRLPTAPRHVGWQPRRDEEHLLAARQRRRSSSIDPRSRSEYQKLVLWHVTAFPHLPAEGKRASRFERASAGQRSAAQREAGQGRFEDVDKCGSPLWAPFGHAMLACSGPANARSQPTLFSC